MTVGGEACNITSAPSANELLCTAPLNPPNGQTEAEVRVSAWPRREKINFMKLSILIQLQVHTHTHTHTGDHRR